MADTATIKVRADTTQAERALGNLQTALAAVVTVGTARALASIADVSTTLTNRLNQVAVAQGDVAGTLRSITQIANTARTPLADTGQLYFTIARSARDLGVNNEQALRTTELISKSLSASGTSAQAASGALVQLGQALAQDSVRGDELNSILEGMPDLAIAIANRFGVTVGALKLLGEQGRITGRDLIDSVAAAADQIERNFARALPTISQALTVLSNSFTNFVGELDRATGGAGTAANAIIRIAQAVDSLAASLNIIKGILEVGLIVAVTALGFRFGTALAATGGLIATLAASFRSLGTTARKTYESIRDYVRMTPRFNVGPWESFKQLLRDLSARQKHLAEQYPLVFATISGLGATIYTYWDRVVNRVKEYLGLTRSIVVDQGEINGLLMQQAFIEQHIADQTQRNGRRAVEEEGLRLKAQYSREASYRQLIKSAEQEMVLAGLTGQERERVALMYRLENALVKEITDSQGKLIGYSEAVTNDEMRKLSAIEQQRQQYERIQTLNEEIRQAGESVIKSSAQASDPRIAVEQKFITDRIALENYFIQNSLMSEQQYQDALTRLTTQYTRDRISAEMQLTRTKLDEQFKLENAALIRQNELFKIRLQQLQELSELSYNQANQELIFENTMFELQSANIARTMNMQFTMANQELILKTQIYDLEVQQQERLNAMRQSMFQQDLQRQGFTLENAKAMARERAAFEQKSEMEKTQFALQQGATIFDSLGRYNRRAFEAAKAFNIANAIMNTYMGATKALATYPPPFNVLAAAAVVAAGLAQVAQIRSQTYQGRALGGSIVGGQQYIVGERGPELITAPSGGGMVTPNNQLGGTTNINFTVNTVDARGFDQLLAERRPMIINMIRQAQNDRGRRATV
jgi:tape measure domain-containing protein